jgi:hypothetical protein
VARGLQDASGPVLSNRLDRAIFISPWLKSWFSANEAKKFFRI